MPDVFISYSRLDSSFTYQLRETLKNIPHPAGGEIDCWLDTEDIEFSAQWWARICKGIEESSNFAVILSNNYLASEVCNEELLLARRLGKPVIPVLLTPIARQDYQERILQRQSQGDWSRNAPTIADENQTYLSSLNYIVVDRIGFEAVVDAFVGAIFEDIELKDRARTLLTRAQEWQNNRRDPSYLLTGTEISTAEEWRDSAVAQQFPIEALHVEYISTSRVAARRVQQRLLVGVSGALVIVLALAVLALLLFNQSESRLNLANESGTLEGQARAEAERNLQEALRVQSRFLANTSSEALANGDIQEAIGLGLRALDYFPQIFNQTAYQALIAAMTSPMTEQIRFPQPDVRSVRWSPDGQLILSGGGDGTVRVSDKNSGKILLLIEHGSSVFYTEWNTDLSLIYVWSEDNRRSAYDAGTGTLLPDEQVPNRFGGDALRSPDGRYTQESAKILAEGIPILTLTDDVDTFAWSHDSTRFIATTREGQGTIYHLVSGIQVPFQAADRVFEIQWNHDNTRVATLSSNAVVQVWDGVTGQQIFRFEQSYENRTAFDNISSVLKWNADGSRLLSTSDAGEVFVWDVLNGRALHRFQYEGYIFDADWTADGSQIALVLNSEVIVLGKPTADTLDDVTYLEFPPEAGIMSGQLSRDGQRLLTANLDETARVWDLRTGKAIITLPHEQAFPYALGGASWNADETRILTWAPDGTVNIWDLQTGDRLIMRHGDVYRRNIIVFASWNANETQITSTDENGVTIVWDARTGAKLSETTASPAPNISDETIQPPLLSPDGRYTAEVLIEEGFIQIRDVQSGELLDTLEHAGLAYAEWGSVPDMLISQGIKTSDDLFIGFADDVHIWNLTGDINRQPHLLILSQLRGAKQVFFTPNRRHIITIGYDNKVRVWLVDIPQMIAIAQRLQTRPLNNDELGLAFLATAVPSPMPTDTLTATPTATLDLTRITATPFASDTPYPTETPTPKPFIQVSGDSFKERLRGILEQGIVMEGSQRLNMIPQIQLVAAPGAFVYESLQAIAPDVVLEAEIIWSENSSDEMCGFSLILDDSANHNLYVNLSRVGGVSIVSVNGNTSQQEQGISTMLNVGRGEANTLLIGANENRAVVYVNGQYSGQAELGGYGKTPWAFAVLTGGTAPDTTYRCTQRNLNIWSSTVSR